MDSLRTLVVDRQGEASKKAEDGALEQDKDEGPPVHLEEDEDVMVRPFSKFELDDDRGCSLRRKKEPAGEPRLSEQIRVDLDVDEGHQEMSFTAVEFASKAELTFDFEMDSNEPREADKTHDWPQEERGSLVQQFDIED
jgi:hypothetical protein